VLEHTSYFPDLAPCDNFKFLKLKILNESHCVGEVQGDVRTVLKEVSENDF